MQTLWTRTAQSRCLCGCHNCVLATKGIARQTATAATKRRVRTGDVFTLFASSLAATATLIDSRRKDARSKKLDKMIDEVREQVQATETQQEKRLVALADSAGRKSVADFQDSKTKSMNTVFGELFGNVTLGHPRSNLPQDKVDTWVDVFNWAAGQADARFASGFQDWKGVPFSLLRRLSPEQLQDLLSNKGLLGRFYGGSSCTDLIDGITRKDLSAKKTKTLEYSIAKLVLRLLWHSSSSAQKSAGTLSVEGTSMDQKTLSIDTPAFEAFRPALSKDDSRELDYTTEPLFRREGSLTSSSEDFEVRQNLIDIDSRLKSLRDTDASANSVFFEEFDSPSAPKFNRSFSTSGDEAKALNRSLHGILREMTREQDLTPSISKICFNLLTSKVPPNIHTYNMLLVKFCALDKRRLVNAVYSSMRESHISPNEITHSTLLGYYTTTNKAFAFTRYLLLMSGFNGGLSIASPDEIISPIASDRYRDFSQNRWRENGNVETRWKSAAKARMNGEVYESLIAGVLQFFGAQTAMQYYRDMVDEGWKPSIDLLTAILKSCCESLDWEGGVSVWNQIKETAGGARRASYQWMLVLCQAFGQRTMFDCILHEGLSNGHHHSFLLEPLNGKRSHTLDVCSTDVKRDQHQTSVSWMTERIKTFIEDSIALAVRGTSSSLSTLRQDESPADLSPEDKLATNCPPKRLLFEQELAALSSAIADTTAEVNGWKYNFRTFRPEDTSRSILTLSSQVRRFNEDDCQKMSSKEYQIYQHSLHSRLRKQGQIISRTEYETYKSEMMAKLVKAEQEGVKLSQRRDEKSRDQNQAFCTAPVIRMTYRKKTPVTSIFREAMKRAEQGNLNVFRWRPPPSNSPGAGLWNDASDSGAQMAAQAYG